MIRLFCKLFLSVLLAVSLMPLTVRAQQNLFNIPSGDITPKGKIFYQHQFNVYSSKFESKGHFVYGLGRNWDAGINLVGKGAYFSPRFRALHNDRRQQGAVFPVLMGTLQKQVPLTQRLAVNIGTQAGVNLSRHLDRKEFLHFTYALANYQLGPGRKLLVGGYATTPAYVGQGNRAGIMVGYEWKMTERWYMMGDWISGRHSASVGVLGLMYTPSKRVQLCFGALIPNQQPRMDGIVLELNLLGWDPH